MNKNNGMKKKASVCLMITSLLMLSAYALAADQPPGQTETLADFVQQEWQLQGFQLGRDSVLSTIPLRVSTYSTPAFIHRGQLESLHGKSEELSTLCKRQGGSWSYIGPSKPADHPLPPNPVLAGAIERAPVSEAGIHALVMAGEQSVASDVAKAMVQSMLTQPDRLVAEALEYAVRHKWLGSFQCQRESATWTASISYSKWANRIEHSLVYKDVTLKIELAEKTH
ncbi:hypothetical protein [Chromobacterium violaceum]|uniref:hypothetical protein n=1 Tax=Chromobacterium violaceum TaxID=536 RepID=UPI001B3455AD|nr:hypothetical protein [Chromobacterium violaceum]MBP4045562.1 hypothetical protein [Chromobacterium violaceum]